MRYFIFLLCCVSGLKAQTIRLIAEKKGVSFRGLSAVSDKIIWVSGSSGTIGKSIDAGKTWEWIQVRGYETKEFRDIEALDEHSAIVMAVGEPAVILKTENDGRKWKAVYTNSTPGMFLDAMEFWNDESGIVIGDPVNGRFFVARTFDGGNNWRALSQDKLPVADSGEACFAASGTNVRALTRGEACFISGGLKSRFFFKNMPIDLPLLSGKQTQGANSVAVWYKNRKVPRVVVVGGDFEHPKLDSGNCAISNDGGKTWIVPQMSPNGYRSCVEFISQDRVITCGITGVDVSNDRGMNWKNISGESFHVCRKAKKGKSIYLAGSGKIGKLEP
jgi:photosystem II stability/assembly factor-like uncharacterized protein